MLTQLACEGFIDMLGSAVQQTFHALTQTEAHAHTHAHTHTLTHTNKNKGGRKACAPPCPKPVLNRSPKVLRRPMCLGSDQNLRGTDIPAVSGAK